MSAKFPRGGEQTHSQPSVYINWMSPFPNLGLLGGIVHFYSNYKRNFCKQTVESLAASDLVLHCLPVSHKKDASLIWVNETICDVLRVDHVCKLW